MELLHLPNEGEVHAAARESEEAVVALVGGLVEVISLQESLHGLFPLFSWGFAGMMNVFKVKPLEQIEGV